MDDNEVLEDVTLQGLFVALYSFLFVPLIYEISRKLPEERGRRVKKKRRPNISQNTSKKELYLASGPPRIRKEGNGYENGPKEKKKKKSQAFVRGVR